MPMFKNRLLKVKNELEKSNLDALLISSVSNITYLTGFSNFSSHEREAYLIIVAQPRHAAGLTHETPEVYGYIITDARYSEAVQISIPHFELIERSIKNPLGEIFTNLAKKFKIKKLGIEEDNLTVNEYKLIKKHYDNTYHYSVSALRIVKYPEEVKSIEKACRLGDKAFNYILKKIKKGATEKQLAFELEHFIKKNGADISFPAIVAFGKNSSVPHHQTSDRKLELRNQFILIDFGVKIDNYCSDMTRTVFFGKATGEQKRMYQTVLEAQQKAIDFLSARCHPELVSGSQSKRDSDLRQNDILASEIDKVARTYIESQGYPTIPHSLGHGIGLEVHEAPRLSPNSKDELKEGMVFSVEPGIYLPGFGGVRIEDLVVLEKSGSPRQKAGPRLLTNSPKNLIEI